MFGYLNVIYSPEESLCLGKCYGDFNYSSFGESQVKTETLHFHSFSTGPESVSN